MQIAVRGEEEVERGRDRATERESLRPRSRGVGRVAERSAFHSPLAPRPKRFAPKGTRPHRPKGRGRERGRGAGEETRRPDRRPRGGGISKEGDSLGHDTSQFLVFLRRARIRVCANVRE